MKFDFGAAFVALAVVVFLGTLVAVGVVWLLVALFGWFWAAAVVAMLIVFGLGLIIGGNI